MDSSCSLGDCGNWKLLPDYPGVDTDVYADPFTLGPLNVVPCHPPPGDQGFHDEQVEIPAPPYPQEPIGSYFPQTATETGFLDHQTRGPGTAEVSVDLGLPSPWITSPMERIDDGWALTPGLWDPNGWPQPAYRDLVSPACSELPGVPQAQAHASPSILNPQLPLQSLPPSQSPTRANGPALRPKAPISTTTARPRSPKRARSTKPTKDPPEVERVQTYHRDVGAKNSRRRCSAQLKMYELKSKGLQEEHLKLLEGRRALKEETLALKEEILAHAGCNDRIISDYISHVSHEFVKEERRKYHAVHGQKCRH
ncbi:hypothetical protein B0T22DRAFT_45214 [Podospora appendiculata]|uniref:BZIP domain-containing protein n=1 Tax=Podospora appendiculata TaxID=314037 RepID=A0AAE0XHM9_9PEZI|nr:hypothetical protein B0T22DRAFT_45214 [Podospora appendiculata]